jgi:hypothetical protein
LEVKKMTIAEVSAQYGLSIDTLRYYERIGLIPPVTRNRNGIRNFTEMDCNWMYLIKYLRGVGIPVEAPWLNMPAFASRETLHWDAKRNSYGTAGLACPPDSGNYDGQGTPEGVHAAAE